MKKFSRMQAAALLSVLAVSVFPTAFAQTAVAPTTGAGSSSASISQGSDPFSDVASSYVNADAITYLKNSGVIQGYSDGSFHPSSEINRAEFTKIVVASLYPNAQGKNCFPDVTTQWFAPYVCEAKAKGIIAGYPDGTFQPDSTINFSEAAKVITNAFQLTPGQSSATDQWFKPYVSALESKNDIPLSIEFFNENLQRDAMAEMIYRLKDNVTDKATRTYSEVVGDNFVTPTSCVDLKKRFDEQAAYDNSANAGQGYAGGSVVEPMVAPTAMEPMNANMMAPEAAPAPGAASSSTAGSSALNLGPQTSNGSAADFSTTNVQVAGVDEGDVVKNDGKYIYIIKDNELRIVEAYPAANLKELVSFTLGDQNETFTPSEMFVDGNTLTVIGSDYLQPYPLSTSGAVPPPTVAPMNSSMPATAQTVPPATVNMTTGIAPVATMAMPMIPSGIAYPYYNSSRTKVFVIDITDRTKPVVTRSVSFDGSYNTSRKVGNTLYMVMNYYYSPVMYYAPQPMIDSAAASTTGNISDGTTNAESSAEAIVPTMLDTKDGTSQMVSPCSQIRILPKQHHLNFLITAAVPLNDLTKDVSRSVVVGSSDNIYASQNNLYVAANDGGEGFYQPYNDYDTDIYQFALGNGTIAYTNKAIVPGQLLNQYSMDESNGSFRVVTTKNEYVPGSEINNNVYVLGTSNMQLQGKIENIAPGEKLYSARFMGDRAYLVTFNRIDPFFVLDLSDPMNPKIAGELKIPGYSSYLQPYDATHILAFGNDVDATKVLPQSSSEPGFLTYDAIKGVKISLYDVSDLSNPKEMFNQIIGDQGTTSAVLSDPKALLFDKDQQLLALSVTVYAFTQTNSCSQYTYSSCPSSCQQVCVPTSCTSSSGIKVCSADCDGANSCVQSDTVYPKPIFDGAYVYSLDLVHGLQLKGKITHYSANDQSALLTNGYADYTKTIQRLMYIGESLYSVSPTVVQANALSDLSQQGQIQLAGTVYPINYGQPLPM